MGERIMETTNGNDPTKLIVDVSSGTIVLLEHCRIVKAEHLPVHHELSDGEMSALAERVGTFIPTLDNYTEEQALDLVAQLSRQFGWKSTIFTRDDIRQAIIDLCGERPTIDLQVDNVVATRMWVKTLEDAVIREGMECIYDAIQQVENGVAL
jgi:hypothetical protein